MISKPANIKFFSQIVDLLQSARNKVVRTVNQTMVTTYFEIGKILVEKEQDGKERAEYGKQILKELSNVLTKEFGKGFSETNLKQMRQFYLACSISQTVSDESKSAISIINIKIINNETNSFYPTFINLLLNIIQYKCANWRL